MRLFNLLKKIINIIKSINQKVESVDDFVIEQGTSGKWRYRKWNSGLIEMWSRQTLIFSGFSAANGLNRSVKRINLPFDITASDSLAAFATGQTSGVFVVGNPDFSGGAGVFELQALRGSGTTSASMPITMYVAGMLK